jgi:hypothetical protein
MGLINKKYHYGWYGSCDSITSDNCPPLKFETDLGADDELTENRSKIESVIRVSMRDGFVFEKYTSYDKERTELKIRVDATDKSFDDYFNAGFKQMECGVGYLLATSGSFKDFELLDFNLADGTSFVSTDCDGLTITTSPTPVVCTHTDFTSYTVGASTPIEDQTAGVISSTWLHDGTISISAANDANSAAPYPVDVLDPMGHLLGHITYTGQPETNKVFYLPTSGTYSDKCLTGDIVGNICQLEEK